MKRIIAIVAGGDSSEHEVSLRSANFLIQAMDKKKYDSYLVEMHAGIWTVFYGEEKCQIDRNDFSFTASDGKHKFDFAYITIHGTPGENGILQGYFDLIGIPYSTSNLLIEALTFNKFALNNFLRSYPNIHISDSILVRKGDEIPSSHEIVKLLHLPCFVKPNAGGSSFGVTKVKTENSLYKAIEKAMTESDEVIIERMINGTEITCGCYKKPNGEIITFPITEVVTTEEFFDYDAKYNGKVQEITPARITERTARRVRDITKFIYRTLGCYGIIRIDYILNGDWDEEQIYLLEINTTPGMTATSFIPQQVKAANLLISDVLSDVIEGKFL